MSSKIQYLIIDGKHYMMNGEKRGKSFIGYNLSNKLELTAHTAEEISLQAGLMKVVDVESCYNAFIDRHNRGLFNPLDGFDTPEGKQAFERKVAMINDCFQKLIADAQKSEKREHQKLMIKDRQQVPA